MGLVWVCYLLGMELVFRCYGLVVYSIITSYGSKSHTNLQASRNISAALVYAVKPDLAYDNVQPLVTKLTASDLTAKSK